MANVVSYLSSQPWKFIRVYFGNCQWLPWQREPKMNQKQDKWSILCDTEVRLTPNQKTSGHQYGC